MAPEQDTLVDDPEFVKMRRARARLSLRFSLLVLSIFAVFIFGIVVFPDAVSGRLPGAAALTLAIALAFFLMFLPALLAGLFLRRMDREVEPLRANITGRRRP